MVITLAFLIILASIVSLILSHPTIFSFQFVNSVVVFSSNFCENICVHLTLGLVSRTVWQKQYHNNDGKNKIMKCILFFFFQN